MNERRVSRRRVLASLGLGTAALAGCLGVGGGESGDGGSGEASGNGTGGSGGTGASGLDHPVGDGIDGQPTLGPAAGTAEATLVAFEDPSCPRCAAFHRDTVPRIRSELVDTGRATYVVRPYPIVYAWGEPATRALWATYERDAEAFWSLLDHYFTEQGSFDESNVVDRTRSWLDAETSVDVDAVVNAAEADGFPAPVQSNLDIGEAEGINGTPTVVMFRDGQYQSRATGSVSYDLITSALNL
ncbi:DsbA family protein [Halomarina oriensis]|uniref:Thioredoxin domain-containing protein n=1 Tax=Halomarina oriensis TaxID=671145 RepID=A0A6B0GR16_9EURY|nr:thioredoxin domain-containing protein [Halomarina oriensis]MWG34565.1 thioredoxin domain-containing protein [Halomarina oriensis]